MGSLCWITAAVATTASRSHRDFRDVEDVVRTYEAWSGEKVERPPA